MKVSLIVTLKDERENIEAWWESLLGQSRLPDELVIVDGGSADGTFEYLSLMQPPFPLKLERREGSNIAWGRNRAIFLASHEVIAVTDGGCVLSPQWLEKILSPLEKDISLQLVAGVYQPLATSWFERASACATLPTLEEIREERFLPSSRSIAFRRRVWEKVGGYPEWLNWGEDMYFNHLWKKMGARYQVAREAVVWWRMRPDPLSLFQQYFRYAWGDGRSGMYPHRHILRFVTYFWLAIGLVLWRRRSWFWGVTLPAALLYLARRWRRIPRFYQDRPRPEKAAALMALPLILLLVDLAKMAGYLAGLKARLKGGWRI